MKLIFLLARTNNYKNILKARNVQTVAIFDTNHFGLRKRRPIFQADFINIQVTNACTLVKRVNFQSNLCTCYTCDPNRFSISMNFHNLAQIHFAMSCLVSEDACIFNNNN